MVIDEKLNGLWTICVDCWDDDIRLQGVLDEIAFVGKRLGFDPSEYVYDDLRPCLGCSMQLEHEDWLNEIGIPEDSIISNN